MAERRGTSDQAKITQVLAARIAIDLRMDFAISAASHPCMENVLIVLKDENGLCGLAEAAPFPYLTGDTIDGVWSTLQSLAPDLAGLSAADAETLLSTRQASARLAPTPTLRAGLELALLDLQARQRGVALHQLWGDCGPAAIESDLTVPALSPSEMGDFKRCFQSLQPALLKIKVGGSSIADDVERVSRSVENFSPPRGFSIDGNQAFTAQSAQALLDALERAHLIPLFFEQPVHEKDWAGFERLARTSAVPLCADESVRTAGDARRVVDSGCASIINIKFMKSGAHEARRIMEVCQRHSIELMIGGMVESEVGMTHSLHAAAGSGLFRWFDLDTPFFQTEWLTTTSPFQTGSCTLFCPDALGLGLELSSKLTQDLQILAQSGRAHTAHVGTLGHR